MEDSTQPWGMQLPSECLALAVVFMGLVGRSLAHCGFV